jgi:hypothetical protein
MLPTFYQTHLQKQLTHTQLKLLTILLELIQSEKQVRLERLARVFPYPITTESRRRKLQRFLDIPQLTIALQKVSINQLLVNHVLLCGANFINCDRPQSMGVYQSVYVKRSYPEGNRLTLAAKSHPIVLVYLTQIR